MFVEWNGRALAPVERHTETTQLARGYTRTKLTPRSWEWSIDVIPVWKLSSAITDYLHLQSSFLGCCFSLYFCCLHTSQSTQNSILEWLFLLRIGETTIRNKLACTTGPNPAWAARCLWVWCKVQALVYDLLPWRKAMLGVWVWWGSWRQWPVAAWGPDLNRQGSTHRLPLTHCHDYFSRMTGLTCAGSSVADSLGWHTDRITLRAAPLSGTFLPGWRKCRPGVAVPVAVLI